MGGVQVQVVEEIGGGLASVIELVVLVHAAGPIYDNGNIEGRITGVNADRNGCGCLGSACIAKGSCADQIIPPANVVPGKVVGRGGNPAQDSAATVKGDTEQGPVRAARAGFES